MDLYLKEVRMENFKSFGKKLTVPFFPGFTAITGPNGSGKSNIADAILFVLGPKSSKTMRADRLTDLIFNGGKKRKNPAKHCKVSLVFDNKQRKLPVNSNEVLFTRMIKRAPLKDNPTNYYTYYYINEKSSSYSEFMEILLHAQISGDGYNIVKQGDVTSIIEMGNVDRRRIIDEIAGISHFDNDIKKAENEKEETDTNMDRIQIILREIDAQLKQLKNDRDEAYRYKELQEKLEENKAKLAEKKKIEINQQIAEINQQITSYKEEQNTLTEKSNIIKTQLKEKQKELKEIENHIADVGGEEVNDIKKQIDSLREEEIKTVERINYAKDEIHDLKEDLKTQEQRLDQITTDLSETEQNHENITEKIEELTQQITEKETAYKELKDRIAQSDDQSIDLSKEIAELRETFENTTNDLHEKKLSLQRLTEQLNSLDETIADLQETKTTYEFELKDIQWQLSERKKAHGEQRKQRKKLEQNLFEKKKQQAELTEQLNDVDNQIRSLQQQKAKLEAEYEAISSVHQKYNRAVNQILNARDTKQLQGIHGTIAELAQVEPAYKTAMAIAAGGRMQSIIVEDDQAAAKAIHYLQKRHLGRATFLPLNKMIAGKPRGKALMTVKDEHAHGFAIDLINFQDEYRGAFWYVFGDTIVVDSLKDARRMMGGVRLVDLQGSLIEASGAMKGGSKPKTQIAFGEADRTKLDEVSNELRNALTHQEQLQQHIQQLKQEITDIENELGTMDPASVSEHELQDISVRKKTFQTKKEKVSNQLQGKQDEYEALTQEKNKLTDKITALQKTLESLDEQKQQKGKRLLSKTSKEDAQEARDLENTIAELKDNKFSLNADLQGITKQKELLEQQQQERSEKITEIKDEIKQHQTDRTDLTKKREEFTEQIQTLQQVQEQMSDKIKGFTTKRDTIYKDTVDLEHQLDKITTRVESYYDLVSRAKYRLPTLEDALKEINDQLEVYDVTVDTNNLPPVDSLKHSIQLVEENMRELEPVNMRALEEYDHQLNRKQKLDEDITHLQEQRYKLIDLVDEITKKKEEKFYKVYHEINKNLKEIYPELSEGGEAELKLDNPDNLFDSGLTIKARPRGKKVLLLSALSGGEKSIASLAFIFAIQHYDPSPFYVLDEVDMFLDGVNAENVSRMVKQNALDSQFIMVSLRKIALKEADHVYGVTMQDTGISDMIGNVDPNSVGPKGELAIAGA
ncbi:MAG: chromosome segregation protein SMC [Candidatus Thermoplasmatota archaeon]|nr:chromosome segregation protein SMC [Candidatus Thermoplasmatota archaeon]